MTFSLTMRLKPGGAITEALFSIARKLAELRPEFLADSRPLGLSARLVGIVGDSTLEPRDPIDCAEVAITSVHSNAPKRLLWIAGGIGITPFLAMLSGISSCSTEYEITLVLSTREPDILHSLLSNAVKATPRGVKLIVHVFSRTEVFESFFPPSVPLHHHSGRITSSILSNFKGECRDGVYVCGPESFERVVMQGVVGKLKREGFAY
jgi:hypothetical protein